MNNKQPCIHGNSGPCGYCTYPGQARGNFFVYTPPMGLTPHKIQFLDRTAIAAMQSLITKTPAIYFAEEDTNEGRAIAQATADVLRAAICRGAADYATGLYAALYESEETNK